MSSIKPIETVYNGYRFRSRLEARWAVFFDAAGIEYQYEPEGFDIEGEWYLPDFYLTEMNAYVEVKNKNAFNVTFNDNDGIAIESGTEDAGKYLKFALHFPQELKSSFLITMGDPFEAFAYPDTTKPPKNMFAICNSRCRVHSISLQAATPIYAVVDDKTECKKLCNDCNQFNNMGIHIFPVLAIADDLMITLNPSIYELEAIDEGNLIISSRDLKSKEILKIIFEQHRISYEAALKARQARFEHGEHGAVS